MANELYHREEKKDHKYIAKVGKGKKTRYFYTKEEWLAYLKGSKTQAQEPKKSTIKSFSDLVGNGKNILESLFKTSETKKSETIAPIKTAITKAVNEGQKFVSSVVNKIDKSVATKQSEKGKNYLSDKANENLGALFIIPTDFVIDVIENIVDAFSKDDKKEKEKDKDKLSPKDAINEMKAPLINEDEEVPEWAEDLDLKEEELTHSEDQALINPEYDPYDEEYSMNCAYCTAAYDLRMRGYDVEAMPYDPDTYSANMETVSDWYEDTSIEDWAYNSWVVSDPDTGKVTFMNPSEVFERTKSTFDEMPDGSYGQYCVYWSMGGGHSMTWEKQNGLTIIRDCQTNQTFTYSEWIDEYADSTSATAILRTDNREPSEEILKTVRNREEDDE